MVNLYPGSPPDRTMPQKEELSFFRAMAVAALCAESVAVIALSVTEQLYVALWLHILVVGLLTLWVYHRVRSGDSRFPILLLLLTAIAGPFGAAACLLSSLVYVRCAATAVPPIEWMDALFAQEEILENDRLYERIAFGLDDLSPTSGVKPFQDILTSGTVLQKQMSIAKITRYFSPRFAPLLLYAVKDVNPAVRVQAATALAKLERDFMKRYMQFESELKRAPYDKHLRLKLAQLCDEYAHAGLIDRDSQRSLRLRAIDIYEDALQQDWENHALRLKLARLYMRQGQPDETCNLLRKAVESGDITAASIPWYMEALFRMKELSQLRQVAHRYSHALRKLDSDTFTEETKDTLSTWLNDRLVTGAGYAA